MNDDEKDEMLIQGVRDYNVPGPVPREEIWGRVQAARRDGKREKGDGSATKRGAWVWASIGIAAALILAVGIVIGRRMDRSSPVQPPVAVNPPKVDSTKPATTRDSLINQLRDETKKTGRRAQELAQAAPKSDSRLPSPDSRLPSPDSRRPEPGLAYRLVVLQHLAGTEAMITSFRSSARGGEIDSQMATWSKELLSTTRLLESSQAAKDPVMKRLLEDLDLVISQIVQYTTRGVSNSEELDLIEQSINKRSVMTKLRSTLPGRGLSAGT